MSGAIPHSPNTLSWRSARLKPRDNFTFPFSFNVGKKFVSRREMTYAEKNKVNFCCDVSFDVSYTHNPERRRQLLNSAGCSSWLPGCRLS
jgi:hypothetical protein